MISLSLYHIISLSLSIYLSLSLSLWYRIRSCLLWPMGPWSPSCVRTMRTMRKSINNWTRCKHHDTYMFSSTTKHVCVYYPCMWSEQLILSVWNVPPPSHALYFSLSRTCQTTGAEGHIYMKLYDVLCTNTLPPHWHILLLPFVWPQTHTHTHTYTHTEKELPPLQHLHTQTHIQTQTHARMLVE